MTDKRSRLIEIVRERSLSHGTFKLASGAESGYYFDMKPTILDPEGANLVADLVLEALGDREIDGIGGLALGAIPIVTAVTLKSAAAGRPVPGFYVRKEQKERGAEKLIDGNLPAGGEVVIVEDVTTKGGSSLRAVEAVRAAGCKVDTVIAIVDRQEGAAATLAENGLKLIALTTRDDYAS